MSKKNKNNTLLWRLEGEHLPEASYLFGTMHVKDQRAFGMLDTIYSCINECASFATEFNLEEANHRLGSTAMDLPDGKTLDQLIKPKVYRKLQKIFIKTTGLDLDLFKNVRPLLITSLLSERILSEDMPTSLDETLWQYARDQEKIVLGIETYEEQIAILQRIPIEYQLKSLIWAGKNFKRFRRQLLKMTSMYEEADLQKLHKAARKSAKGLRKSAKGLRKIMIYDRNIVMADRIIQMTKEQSLFAAVGAGHLGGKKGVLKLLKERGLKVKGVRINRD